MQRIVVAGRAVALRLFRTLTIGVAVAALAVALALGVASAADATATSDATAAVPPLGRLAPGVQNQRWGALRLAPWRAPRRPLHKILEARLWGETPRPQPQGRVILGRIVELGQDTATIGVAGGQRRVVRLTPQTRLPARRPRAGDLVLVIGRPATDGTWVARTVVVRRQREGTS